MTQRGPSTGLPQLVTSFSEFQRKYGSYFDFGPTFAGHSSLPFAVDGFFTNLGKLLYISRVLPPGATKATVTTQGGLVTRLVQDTSIAVALQKQVRPATLRGIQVGTQLHLRMVKNGIVTDSADVTVTAINGATGIVTINTALTSVFEARYTTVFTDTGGVGANGAITTLATPTSARPNSFSITAIDEGSWGKKIAINVSHESAARSPVDSFVSGAAGNNQIKMKSGLNFYVNAWVEIDQGNDKHYRKVVSVSGLVVTLDGPAMAAADVAPQAPATVTYLSITEFRLTASYQGQTEQYSGLTFENVPGRYYVDQINPVSSLIQVGTIAGPPA